jgi:hypothetical protein
MLLFIVFIVRSSYIFDIVMIDNECIHMLVERLVLIVRKLGGRLSLSMVLRWHLPVNASYWPAIMVDHDCDFTVDSSIVHTPSISIIEPYYKDCLALFLIFLANVPYV